jgi:membrane protein implicated in regulation of membrane protease activity
MILNLGTWWQSLAFFDKIFWAIALLFSAIFLLQSIISLFAGGDFDDISGDADDAIGGDDGAGHQFFTIKNMIAFFTIFGWMGIAVHSSGAGKFITVAVALSAGIAIVLVMALLLKNVHRLRHDGTMQIRNAIGLTGNTYLLIPAKRSGQGKVHIKVQGSLHELPAMTDDELDIATGRLIKVTSIINERILLVTPVN